MQKESDFVKEVTTAKNDTKNNLVLLQYIIFKCLGTLRCMEIAVLIEIAISSHNNWLYESLFSQLVENQEKEDSSLPLFAVQKQGKIGGEFSENTVGEHEIVKNL